MDNPLTITYTITCNREYKAALDIFFARLHMKDLLKGTSHRNLSDSRLFSLLTDEVNELQEELDRAPQHETKIIEESCDVMICGLLMVDRTLQGGVIF